jgi:hypothetical protein
MSVDHSSRGRQQRKRKSSATDTLPMPSAGDDKRSRLEARMQRNRESAQRSRERKQAVVDTLEAEVGPAAVVRCW